MLLTGSGHVLGDEDRFEEFPVQPQPARDVATLKSTLGQIAVVRSLSTRRLRLVKPVADFLEAPRRVVGAGGHQPGHEVMIGPSQHSAAILRTVAKSGQWSV